MKSSRPKFNARLIRLSGLGPLQGALSLLKNLPIDPARPLEIEVREERKVRGLDQNAAYWAGPLRCISEQAWIAGRQFSAEVLHEHFKREFLPEADDEEIVDLVKDWHTYQKWAFTPNGERVCIGSTTQLTPKGFGRFMQQVEAFGAELGVQFSASPRERAMAA